MTPTVIDERGRLFGRINLIDAFAAVFVFVLIPIAYGAYILFRTPPATLTAVRPNSVYQGPNQHVTVEGINLRPFLRIAFGTTQALTFAVDSTTSAHVDLPDLLPGAYDVVLYDFRDEVARLPKAFTVLAPATVSFMTMDVTGSFKNLTTEAAQKIQAGQTFKMPTDSVSVLRAAPPVPSTFRMIVGTTPITVGVNGQVEVPATIRINCYSDVLPDGSIRCMTTGPQHSAPVAPDSLLTLPGPQGWATFQVSSVALPFDAPTVEVRAIFSTTPEIAAMVKPGDADADVVSYRNEARGRIVVVNRSAGGAVDATLHVPAVQTAAGWVYHSQPLKAGLPFRFETSGYAIVGTAQAVRPLPAAPSR
jgi:hypothetical protein